ncbi:N-acetylmuramoyl-L-alanine amidase [Propionivibrio limicola]|uniref:N-acetylmuramoyl-L-alanine amidase n=1 Tax=Propionivibrio limicola TaxID=167645 RepID=UPI001290A35F|nr:N-acetylmuramoyl-L-alanine amidase [Propionivibrio limicola]
MTRHRLLGAFALLAGLAAQATEVAVDVGHTLAASGAVSARGRKEFDFNRELAARVAAELAARRLAVRKINFDGRIGSLYERPQQAAGSDLFISIHHDSVQAALLEEWEFEGKKQTYSDRHIGFSLFVSRDNPDLETSLRCASAIGARLRRLGFPPATHHADSMPGRHRPYADVENAVHYYDNLVVLYRTTLPAVLFEAGIIKHRAEEMALRDPLLQARMADAVATGIAACLSVR